MDTLSLIDSLKERFNLATDKEAAELLCVDPKQLNHWRTGFRPMPLAAKIRAADKLGYAWARDAMLFLAPDLIEKDNERAKKRVSKKTG